MDLYLTEFLLGNNFHIEYLLINSQLSFHSKYMNIATKIFSLKISIVYKEKSLRQAAYPLMYLNKRTLIKLIKFKLIEL